MNIAQAKTLHLPTLLEKAGAWLDETKSSPSQDSYFFKLRDERTASVHVWKATNGSWCWKDHGTGEGGDIIKFGQYMAGGDKSVSAGLAWLRNHNSIEFKQKASDSSWAPVEPRPPKYTVEKIKHLFAKPYNKSLLAYINNRQISAKIVANYVSEVHFADKEKKKLFGLGLPAEPTDTTPLGSWEIRTALDAFPKCVIGDKNISIIDSPGMSRKTVNVFEGMFDFFTWLEMTGQHYAKHPPTPVIVLNSTTMASRAAMALNDDIRFKDAEQIHFWPQNDDAGKKCLADFLDVLDDNRFRVGTVEHIYINHKDLAECWEQTPVSERSALHNLYRATKSTEKFYDTSMTSLIRRAHESKLRPK